MWDGDNFKDSKAHERSKLAIKEIFENEASNEAITIKEDLDSEEETGTITDNTKTFSKTTDHDRIEEEIEMVEDEVEEVEYNSYPEESDAENQIKTKTKEIMQLMQTIDHDDNEIVG